MTDTNTGKLVAGFGINDSDYQVTKNKRIICPYYKEWSQMLYRVEIFGSTVCEEWRYFSVFKAWMVKQNWKGMSLDKDLRGKKNKHYSPDNCTFIPQSLNSMIASILHRSKFKGEPTKYLNGVRRTSSGWQYSLGCKGIIPNASEKITFDTEIEAHKAWCLARTAYILCRIDVCNGDIDLMWYVFEFTKDLHHCKFTTKQEFDEANQRQIEIDEQNFLDNKRKAEREAAEKHRCLTWFAVEVELDGIMQWFPSKAALHKVTKKVHKTYTVNTDNGYTTDTLPGLCRAFGMSVSTVEKRVKEMGMSVELALTTPLQHTRSNSKPPGYWTKERCHTEALKYDTKSEWAVGDKGSYEASKYHGWFNECTAHMKKPFRWTEELLIESAAKYSSLKEWTKHKTAAPAKAREFGILDQCIANIGSAM